jgi:hypothetical protein
MESGRKIELHLVLTERASDALRESEELTGAPRDRLVNQALVDSAKIHEVTLLRGHHLLVADKNGRVVSRLEFEAPPELEIDASGE